MSGHGDGNLLKDVTIQIDDDVGDRSDRNVADLIRFLHEYSIDTLRSICTDDTHFNAVVLELSKLLLEVVPNLREWDGTSTLVIDAVQREKIEFASIRPYLTSKWVRLSQSYLKLYSTPLQNLCKVYSEWLQDRERVGDEEQFNRHKKCVDLLKGLVYITQTIGYVVDEATVAMKIYDMYELITIMIKNGVTPPLELFYCILDRHLVPVLDSA